jgi:carbon monoxide dehydrogenase subunit G
MKISGVYEIPFPPEQVWDALLDPQVLVSTIPGCERLESSGENAYAMTVTAGVAAIKGTYSGACTLTDLTPHESLVMSLTGAGAPGTIDATVQVGFSDVDGGTRISYDADAVVGGMVGGVGQRMLTSVSKRMAKEFFDNVADTIAKPEPVEAAARGVVSTSSTNEGQVFTAPAKASRTGSQEDLLKGIAIGAGLVLAGVIVGGTFGRRRRDPNE